MTLEAVYRMEWINGTRPTDSVNWAYLCTHQKQVSHPDLLVILVPSDRALSCNGVSLVTKRTMVWKQEWSCTRKGGLAASASTRFSIMVHSTSSSCMMMSFFRILMAYNSSVPCKQEKWVNRRKWVKGGGKMGQKGKMGQIGENGSKGENRSQGGNGSKGKKWVKLVKMGQIGENGSNWWKWVKLVKMGQKGKMGQIGENGSKGKNGSNWWKWVKREKWVKLVKMGQKGEMGQKGKMGQFGENGSKGKNGPNWWKWVKRGK